MDVLSGAKQQVYAIWRLHVRLGELMEVFGTCLRVCRRKQRRRMGTYTTALTHDDDCG